MLNRAGLDVLVHPLAGNAYDDHTVYAMWLGDRIAAKARCLKARRLNEKKRPGCAGRF